MSCHSFSRNEHLHRNLPSVFPTCRCMRVVSSRSTSVWRRLLAATEHANTMLSTHRLVRFEHPPTSKFLRFSNTVFRVDRDFPLCGCIPLVGPNILSSLSRHSCPLMISDHCRLMTDRYLLNFGCMYLKYNPVFINRTKSMN